MTRHDPVAAFACLAQLAIQLASRFNGEIINADSMQIYKGLDIAAAKVTHDEMQGFGLFY